MKNIKCEIIGVSELYIPENIKKNSVIIVIGGSSGGLRSNFLPQFFASQGIVSAVIPYFNLEGLATELKKIPLEHFKTYIDKISNDPSVVNKDIYIHGTSKGAEATLLLIAKNIAKVKGAILLSPTSHVWPVPVDEEKLASGEESESSSWCYEGKEVEFVRFDKELNIEPIEENKNGEVFRRYSNTWIPKIKGRDGIIDLSENKTKVLLISGKDDGLWPSCEFAQIIQKESLNKELVEHISFENVGHIIPPPGRTARIYSKHDELGINIVYGGEQKSIKEASQRCWEAIKIFINYYSL